jgi:hypothetical protein
MIREIRREQASLFPASYLWIKSDWCLGIAEFAHGVANKREVGSTGFKQTRITIGAAGIASIRTRFPGFDPVHLPTI